jgi:transcription initiation factor TFIIA large subunit
MSNLEASKLYEAIIEEVINESRQDFEESGIDESTLEDLRKIWCQKLSQSLVAKFSWDDENNIHDEYSHLANVNGTPSSGVNSMTVPINQSISVPVDLGSVSGLELPNVQHDPQFSYPQATANMNSMGIEIPHLTKEEDNDTGLMLPRINQADGSFEFTITTDQSMEVFDRIKKEKKPGKMDKIGQSDGALDDDDDNDIFNDSDDINSDLDEGLESEKSDDEDGDQEGQIMLCLYDKVQRVKNKWKSNLKEGIANIDGRDYVFQKATGESEW